jgi:hypothetical protein
MKPSIFTGTLVVASAADTAPRGSKPGELATLAVAVATLLLLLQVPPAFKPTKKPVHVGGGGT